MVYLYWIDLDLLISLTKFVGWALVAVGVSGIAELYRKELQRVYVHVVEFFKKELHDESGH